MTNDQINVAIAKECGTSGWWCPKCKRICPPREVRFNETHDWYDCESNVLPARDYTTDLNAMHDAAMLLRERSPSDYTKYITEVTAIAARSNPFISVCDATARQRAEAFLKTKGLWKEAKE